MAFSKIAGLAVTPRSESTSISRWSSPPSIRLRRIWSSHTLVPAAVRAARRGLTSVLTLMGGGLLCRSSSGLGALQDGLCAGGDVLRGESEVLVQSLLRGGRSE